MPYQEKNILVSLFSTIVVFAAYYMQVFGMYQDGRFDGADATSLLGKSILILIAVSIAVHIVASILFNILFAIATNDPKPSFVVDERDKLIELRGLRMSAHLTGAGVVLSMVVLALGQPVFLVFNMIILAFAAGDVAGNLLKLCLYRTGF